MNMIRLLAVAQGCHNSHVGRRGCLQRNVLRSGGVGSLAQDIDSGGVVAVVDNR